MSTEKPQGQTESDARLAPAIGSAASWQPIETAPKDGTPVLVWAENLLHGLCPYAVAQYMEHEIEWWHVQDGKFGPYPMRGAAPTHWMPCPKPPNDKAEPRDP